MKTDRQTDEDRKIDRQTKYFHIDRFEQVLKKTDRMTERQAVRQTDIITDRGAGKQAGKHAGRQTS
jgi:hypothetical protein